MRQGGVTEESIRVEHFEHRKREHPTPIETQLAWLRSIGFAAAECFWNDLNLPRMPVESTLCSASTLSAPNARPERPDRTSPDERRQAPYRHVGRRRAGAQNAHRVRVAQGVWR
jgi:hypothetical protein